MSPNKESFAIDRVIKMTTNSMIAVMLAYTWGFTGFPKLFGDGVPEWFIKDFGSTFLADFPGMTLSFYSIALAECIAALLAVAALVRMEFLPKVRPLMLQVALLFSMALFVQLGFGKRMISEHTGAFQLYMYTVGALMMLLAVRYVDAGVTSTKRSETN